MRKLTTILCSFAFAISGIMLAKATSSSPPGVTVQAATPTLIDMSKMRLPTDLTMGLEKEKDTVTVVRHDTVYVNKTKYVKARAPRIVKERTIHVPVLYIATRTNKEDSVNNRSGSIYKVEKIGNACLNCQSSGDINQYLVVPVHMLCAVDRNCSQVSTLTGLISLVRKFNLVREYVNPLKGRENSKGRTKCV